MVDANPYAAPRPVATVASSFMRSYWCRFPIALAFMALVNAVPLFLTWQAYGTDGVEVIGWPFTFYSRGGYFFVKHFSPQACLADGLVALLAAHLLAVLLKNGWRKLLRRISRPWW
jgi:hypothetical protein